MSIKSIFLVTNKTSEPVQQGIWRDVITVATYEQGYTNKTYPAFHSEAEAKAFIDNVSEHWKPNVIELQVWDGIFPNKT